MIKKTTIDILKKGVNSKYEGYCYRVTAENYKFWDDYTDHCLAIEIIKNKYNCNGFLFFHSLQDSEITQLSVEMESNLNYCETNNFQVILVQNNVLMDVE
jgi:hypothetical protein